MRSRPSYTTGRFRRLMLSRRKHATPSIASAVRTILVAHHLALPVAIRNLYRTLQLSSARSGNFLTSIKSLISSLAGTSSLESLCTTPSRRCQTAYPLKLTPLPRTSASSSARSARVTRLGLLEVLRTTRSLTGTKTPSSSARRCTLPRGLLLLAKS